MADSQKGRVVNRAMAMMAVAVLAGCELAPPAPEVAPPELHLIDSQPLVMAEDCAASGSVFVEFTVRADGRTDDVKLPEAPACVRAALSTWVDSFRYSPRVAGVATGIEWLLVSARRGS
jgi:hypothetical protein